MPKKRNNKTTELVERKKYELVGKEISEREFAGYDPEDELLPFVGIRQKRKGDRQSGNFKVNDKTDPDREDIEELYGVILAVKRGRVYFADVDDRKPECKSINGIEGNKYGRCAVCLFNQFDKQAETGPNGKQCSKPSGAPACSEIRNIAFKDDNAGFFVLTLGPSGLYPFRVFSHVLKKKQKTPQAVFHRVRVRFGTLHCSEVPSIFQGDYFVPEIELVEPLPPDQLAEILEARKGLGPRFETSVKKMEHEAEDFTGNGDSPEPEEAETVKQESGNSLPF